MENIFALVTIALGIAAFAAFWWWMGKVKESAVTKHLEANGLQVMRMEMVAPAEGDELVLLAGLRSLGANVMPDSRPAQFKAVCMSADQGLWEVTVEVSGWPWSCSAREIGRVKTGQIRPKERASRK